MGILHAPMLTLQVPSIKIPVFSTFYFFFPDRTFPPPKPISFVIIAGVLIYQLRKLLNRREFLLHFFFLFSLIATLPGSCVCAHC